MPLLAQSLSENRRTLALAAPIIAGFVGQMLMGWADTIMVGKVGVIRRGCLREHRAGGASRLWFRGPFVGECASIARIWRRS